MNTSRTFATGDDRAGAHIEYVKRRQVLRLEGWHGDSERLESVELPLRAFLERLDIDVQDVALHRRYLLFSGVGRPGGGARDLTGVFESEQKARAAFHALRTERRSPSAWAQLVLLDDRGRSKPLCWFDADPLAARGVASRNDSRHRQPRRRPWRRKRGGTGGVDLVETNEKKGMSS